MSSSSPTYVSPADLAQRFNLHPAQVRAAVRRGELPAIRCGRLVRIDLQAAEAAMATAIRATPAAVTTSVVIDGESHIEREAAAYEALMAS